MSPPRTDSPGAIPRHLAAGPHRCRTHWPAPPRRIPRTRTKCNGPQETAPPPSCRDASPTAYRSPHECPTAHRQPRSHPRHLADGLHRHRTHRPASPSANAPKPDKMQRATGNSPATLHAATPRRQFPQARTNVPPRTDSPGAIPDISPPDRTFAEGTVQPPRQTLRNRTTRDNLPRYATEPDNIRSTQGKHTGILNASPANGLRQTPKANIRGGRLRKAPPPSSPDRSATAYIVSSPRQTQKPDDIRRPHTTCDGRRQAATRLSVAQRPADSLHPTGPANDPPHRTAHGKSPEPFRRIDKTNDPRNPTALSPDRVSAVHVSPSPAQNTPARRR